MIRRLGLALRIVVIFLPGIARAQTTGLSVLPVIAEFESSGNPTAQNPSSSASGLYGDTNSTWAEALSLCGCGTTDEYPTAASAPPSVQTAANAALIDSVGLQPWLCAGCDVPLAAAIQADGRASAFDTADLSADPATYAALDTSSGLAAYLAADSGTATAGGGGLTVSTTDPGTGATGTVGTGTLASAAAASGATAQTATGNAQNPFTYLWNEYATGIAQPLQMEVAQLQTVAAPYLTILLTLMLIAMGTATNVGRMQADAFLYRAIRMSVVVAFTAVGSTYYQQYVIDLFGSLPTVFSNGILGANSTNPAAGFDIV